MTKTLRCQTMPSPLLGKNRRPRLARDSPAAGSVIGWGYTTGNYSATLASLEKKRDWACSETCPRRCGRVGEFHNTDSADSRARAAGNAGIISTKTKARLQMYRSR